MKTILPALLFVVVGCATKAPEGNHILNLYDAFGPEIKGTRQDFGFSALIRYNGKTILFDAGTNADILARNAAALGVDLRDVDFAVASHSHMDHISGFDYLFSVNPGVKLYFPNDPFWGALFPFDATGQEPEKTADLPRDQRYFRGGSPKLTFTQSGRFWKADVEFVKESREIAPGINLIATRSPFLGYFSKYPNVGVGGEKSNDAVKTVGLPELSLSLKTPEGEVLIVGCSHSLVSRITGETRKRLNRRIHLVMGGYHLLPYKTDDIRAIATRMKDEYGVTHVAPAHCTGHLGFKIFREVFGERYHLSGLGSVIAFP